MNDQISRIIKNEKKRQNETIDLIPSENYSSKSVREATGSVLMHKYSEGYPNARYYEGNEFIDELEILCMDQAKKVFKLNSEWGVNVQPLSGSNANLAVYNALLEPGDKILSMFLPDGGHLSHGWSLPDKKNDENLEDERIYRGGSRKVNIVSKFFNVVQYKTDKATNLFDWDFIEELARKEMPKMIITGGTAYPRNIDYNKMRYIADAVGAYYLADVAHEAGLIATGVLESPVGIADVITFTTHKTLRGPKGAVILAKSELMQKINKSIIPGMQGGPHNGTIAGIAQALFEADSEEFNNYTKLILSNAKSFERYLTENGFKLVTGGTDKHLLLIDLRQNNISGKYFSRALAHANIITNMNTIPYDTGSPLNPSGLRIGTPTISTRKMGDKEIKFLVDSFVTVLNEAKKYTHHEFEIFNNQIKSNPIIMQVKEDILELCKKFPLPK